MDDFPEYFWVVLIPLLIVILVPHAIGPEGRRRVVTWFTNLPWLVAIRARRGSKPPIFGERTRPNGPSWEDFPEFVLIPKFIRVPPAARVLLKLAWFLVVLFPYGIYAGLKDLYWLNFGHQEYVESQGRNADRRPETLFRHAEIGRRSVIGGKKGGSSNARTRAVAQRNEDIRVEARELLECGKRYDELAGYFAKEYGDLDGYPSTSTQYRNILAPLKEEAEVNKS